MSAREAVADRGAAADLAAAGGRKREEALA